MNVPEKNELRYQHLKKIADLLDWAGDLADPEFTEAAREAYALARKFHDRADGLATLASLVAVTGLNGPGRTVISGPT
jgi:hypothetical protein